MGRSTVLCGIGIILPQHLHTTLAGSRDHGMPLYTSLIVKNIVILKKSKVPNTQYVTFIGCEIFSWTFFGVKRFWQGIFRVDKKCAYMYLRALSFMSNNSICSVSLTQRIPFLCQMRTKNKQRCKHISCLELSGFFFFLQVRRTF